MQIAPVFPDTCRPLDDARTERAGTAWLSTARITCERSRSPARRIAIDGLEAYSTDVLVRVQHADGAVETHVAQADRAVGHAAQRRRARKAVPRAYLVLGIEHIALGVDHLLFVLGLLLIVRDRWTLVKTDHRLHGRAQPHAGRGDLQGAQRAGGAAQCGHRAVDPVPRSGDRPGLARPTSFTIRHPWVVAFAFGLLHGFGFASGLAGSACRAASSRWRCCCSTWASRSGSSLSCCW